MSEEGKKKDEEEVVVIGHQVMTIEEAINAGWLVEQPNFSANHNPTNNSGQGRNFESHQERQDKYKKERCENDVKLQRNSCIFEAEQNAAYALGACSSSWSFSIGYRGTGFSYTPNRSCESQIVASKNAEIAKCNVGASIQKRSCLLKPGNVGR